MTPYHIHLSLPGQPNCLSVWVDLNAIQEVFPARRFVSSARLGWRCAFQNAPTSMEVWFCEPGDPELFDECANKFLEAWKATT